MTTEQQDTERADAVLAEPPASVGVSQSEVLRLPPSQRTYDVLVIFRAASNGANTEASLEDGTILAFNSHEPMAASARALNDDGRPYKTLVAFQYEGQPAPFAVKTIGMLLRGGVHR